MTGHITKFLLPAGGAGGAGGGSTYSSRDRLGGLNMAGLAGQDALDGGQSHRVFRDDCAVGAGFAVLGYLELGVDAMGGPITPPSSTTPPAG